MTHLTADEQNNVRTALKFLRLRFGTVALVGSALKLRPDMISEMLSGRKSVNAETTLRLARFAQIGLDDLLAGKYPVPGTCPHCGRDRRNRGVALLSPFLPRKLRHHFCR